MATDESKTTSTVPDQFANAGTGVFKAWSHLAAGKLAKADSELQATLKNIEAQEIRSAAFSNEARYRKRQGRHLASMMTSIAKSGVRFEGSAARALAESAINAEKTVLEDRFNALDAAAKVDFQADMARLRGKAASGASRIQAFGTLLETGSKGLSLATGGVF